MTIDTISITIIIIITIIVNISINIILAETIVQMDVGMFPVS